MLKETTFKMVGPYLVSKSKKEDKIWITYLNNSRGQKKKIGEGRIAEAIKGKYTYSSNINVKGLFLKCNKYLRLSRCIAIPLADRM